MAHIWFQHKDELVAGMLEGEAFALTPGAASPVARVSASLAPLERAGGPASPALLLRRSEARGAGEAGEEWLLLARAGSGARVNGIPLSASAGLRALRDRDEISLPGVDSLYFSSERLARVEPFPGPDPVVCGRCRSPEDPIRPGDPAVRCNSCGVFHHERPPGDQATGKLCWSYGPTCSACDQSTADAGVPRWVPEEV